jgi:LemA protein
LVVGIIIGVFVFILLIIFIAIYNSLVSLRNQVKNTRGQIDTKLERRYDFIPMLSSSIKRTMGHWRIFNVFAKKK